MKRFAKDGRVELVKREKSVLRLAIALGEWNTQNLIAKLVLVVVKFVLLSSIW